MSTLGRLADPEQFKDIILKTDAEGRLVRLKDVARIELGAQGYDQTCTLDGKPSVALSIFQRPGSNALKTAKLVRDKMDELKLRFPEGLDYAIVYDTTPFITESVVRGLQHPARRRDPGGRGRPAVPPELAVGRDPAGRRAGGDRRHLRRDGRARVLAQQLDAVRPGAGDRHRGRRRHRRRRGRRAPHRARDDAPGRDHPRDGAGLRPGGRHRPGADGGVRAVRVHQRDRRPVLPAVRADHRRLDGDLGVQLADPQPRAGRAAAEASAARGARRRCRGWPTPGSAATSPMSSLTRYLEPPPDPQGVPALGRAGGRGGWPARSPAGSSGRSSTSVLSGFFRLFNAAFQAATGLRRGSSAACSA